MRDLREIVFDKEINRDYTLNGVKCRENIDVDMLKELLKSSLVLTKKWTLNEWGFNQQLENEKQQLTEVLNKINACKSRKKYLPVTYYNEKTTKLDFGRVYPVGSLGLSSIRCKIRHSLAGNNYYDIDMENAHPKIIKQICNKNNIDCQYLSYYVDNREKCLSDIMNVYDVKRSLAKNLIIRLCYGGEFATWLKDNDIYTSETIVWVEGIKNELTNFATELWEKNTHIHSIVDKKKDGDKKNSFLALYAQNIEKQLLRTAFDFFVEKKYIKKNNNGLYNCVLCFDGIMIEKDCVKKDINEVMSELRVYIQTHTKFEISFTNKPMNEGYSWDYIQEKIDTDAEFLEKFSIKYDRYDDFSIKKCEEMFEPLLERPNVYYEAKKYYLENGCFQLAQVGEDIVYVLGGRVCSPSKDKLTTLLKPIKSGFISMGAEIPFLTKWLSDPNKRFHHKLEFYPLRIDETEPPTIYNLFQGFNQKVKKENPFINAEGKIKQQEILKDFLDLVKAQCNDDDDIRDWFLKWFATRVQTPRVKIPVSFIFVGSQGTGVSTMMKLLSCIFREEQTIDSANINDFFGNHAEGFMSKLHINLNEMSLKQTFSYKEALKSAITEDKININPKNIRPIEGCKNYALFTFTSQHKDALPIDVEHGDRRFIGCKRSSRLNTSWNSAKWKKCNTYLQNDEDFINALFWYLMGINIEKDVDWEHTRPQTELYNEMVEINAPAISTFMEDLIENNKYCDLDITPKRCKLFIEDEPDFVEFQKHHLFTKSVRINSSELYKCFKKWTIKYNMFSNGTPSIKKFKKLIGAIDNIKSIKTRKCNCYDFIPSSVIEEMVEKKWICGI